MKSLITLLLALSTILGIAQTSPIIRVANLNALQALPIPVINNSFMAVVDGQSAIADGGYGGLFVYSAASTLTTNTYSVFKPTTTTGRWIRQLASSYNQASETTVGDENTYAFRVQRNYSTNIVGIGGNDTGGYIQSWSTYPLYINHEGANHVIVNKSGGNTTVGTEPTVQSKFNVGTANADLSTGFTSMRVGSTNAFAIDLGGSIGFSSAYTGTTQAALSAIKGAKENATDNNTSGYLAVYTRPAGGSLTERWRIRSDGVIQSPGAQTIQTATGNLTIASAAGNGNVSLSPHGTGAVTVPSAASGARGVSIGSATPADNYPLRINHSADASVVSEFSNANTGTSARALYNLISDAGTAVFGVTSVANSVLPAQAYLATSSGAFTGGLTVSAHSAPIKFANNFTESGQFTAARNFLIGTTAETGLIGAGGLRVAATTSALSSIAGSAVIGNLTAATTVAIGGGNVNAGGSIVAAGPISSTGGSTTLAAAATTLAVTRNLVTLTGDAGANTLATITGGVSGQILVIIFVDNLVTITDDAGGGANTVNLSAAFTSTANDTITLISNGTSWREMARSVN